MMKAVRICFLFLGTFFITHVFAQSTILSANSFSTVQQFIAQTPNPRHLLVALDDDDTLTMEPCPPYSVGTNPNAQCQYLGGPAWFAWQQSLPANDPNRIWTTFPQLLAINNLLFSMSAMPLDDPAIPATLKTISDVGAHVILATARDYDMTDVTESQLSQDGILNAIEARAITTKRHGKKISFAGDYLPKPWSTAPVRAIAYEHGILYLAGQNKGVMLQQFLAKTHEKKRIRDIIFVDDTLQNVIDVANAYKNDPSVHVLCIHYTRLEAHKAALTTGKNAKQLQANATQEWKTIEASLKNNLPGSNF